MVETFINQFFSFSRMKLIEVCCAGNNGRSPWAELFARDRLSLLHATSEYGVISSGVYVSTLDEPPNGRMMRAIAEKAESIMPETDYQVWQANIERSPQGEVARAFFQYALDELVTLENQHKRKLQNRWRVSNLKTAPEQTVVRPDVCAVLAVDQRVYREVLNLYAQSASAPMIACVPAMATNDPAADLPGSFGKPFEHYMETIQQLRCQVPECVDRIIGA